MSLESESDSKSISLSEARAKRRSDRKIEVAPDELKQMLRATIFEAIDDCVAQKLARMEYSMNRIAEQFEAVRNGEAEDAALRVTTDQEATDLALAGIDIPAEDYYVHTCGALAETLGVRLYDVTKMTKTLGLRGDVRYHRSISTGRTSYVQKWSDDALRRLREALDSGEYPRPDIKPKELENQNLL
jgi:hypothetical protein